MVHVHWQDDHDALRLATPTSCKYVPVLTFLDVRVVRGASSKRAEANTPVDVDTLGSRRRQNTRPNCYTVYETEFVECGPGGPLGLPHACRIPFPGDAGLGGRRLGEEGDALLRSKPRTWAQLAAGDNLKCKTSLVF